MSKPKGGRVGGVCLFGIPKVTSLMCGHVLRRHVSQKASDQVMGGLGSKEMLHFI